MAILQLAFLEAEPLSGFLLKKEPPCKDLEGAPELENRSVTRGNSMNISVLVQGTDGSVDSGIAKNKSRSFDSLRSLRMAGSWRVAVCALLVMLGLAGSGLHAQSARTDFKRGQNAEAREDYDTAVDLYQKASAKAPKDITYRTALYRVRVSASAAHMAKGRKLLLAGDEQGALTEFLHASEIDQGNEAATQEIARIRQKHGEVTAQTETSLASDPEKREAMESMSSPVELKPLSNEPLTLHMTEDAKTIYQAIGKAAGINVLFDPDYTSKRVQVDLANMTLLDALRVVGTMSNTFWRPVTSNTIFVAANTRTKRQEQDEQAVQTFYLSNAWQQNDLNDVQTALRNVLTGPNFKVFAVASQNALVVRGTPDELLLAQMLVDDLDKARAEVVVDIAVLEVSKNWERTLGIQWPSSVGVAIQPPTSSTSSTTCPTGSTTCTPSTTGNTPTLYSLAHLQASDFAVTVGSATANLLLTDSDTKILQNPRIRATDGQKATMKIGEKIPIATGSYQTGAATAVVSSLVNTQFTYQDVGVNIEMTPTVHYDHDVTLKIKVEVTTQSGSVTISGVTEPIISQRVVDQVIRLREGEASILGGIQDKQDAVSWSGIPGLSSIPGLKYLFGSKDHTISDDELVFLVVPHIVRTQSLDRANLRTVDLGVGQTVELRHVPVQTIMQEIGQPSGAAPGQSPAPVAPPTRPVPEPRSSLGTVPGESAVAAAPAALAQMRESADANSYAANANRQPDAAKPPGIQPPGRPMPVNVMLNAPSNPVALGSTFQVPVVLTGGTDIVSVASQIQYDPAKLSLVNVSGGDFLSRGGQSADPIHSDPDGKGTLTVNASRPPGAAGVSGAGVVYVLSFQAKTAGQSSLVLTRAGVANGTHQPVPAQGSQANIVVK
jgi:general secretion pathway protein D